MMETLPNHKKSTEEEATSSVVEQLGKRTFTWHLPILYYSSNVTSSGNTFSPSPQKDYLLHFTLFLIDYEVTGTREHGLVIFISPSA